MRLDPYLVIVAPAAHASRVAIVLRAGGYEVTKLADLDAVTRDVVRLHPDGVVLELPPVQANRVVREIASVLPAVPVLTVTSAPAYVNGRAIARAEMTTELISAVDRMLVDAHAA